MVKALVDPAAVILPDAVLPDQFYGDPIVSPEHRLMRSILEDAMACLDLAASLKGVAGQLARRAQLRAHLDVAWFESPDDEWTFSFLRICEEIGYPVSETRRYAREVFAGKKRYQRVNRVSGTRTKLGGRGEE